MANNPLVKPVVKWVGGKRQLFDDILPMIPDFTTYVEPFIGGGAILFELQPKRAIINDFNSELINVYNVINSLEDELIAKLEVHQEKNEVDYFYHIRELDRDTKKYESLTQVERAARLIYLNKTCFNGLFRVNSSGQFNTPYGRYKNPNIVNKTTIKAVSNYFKRNEVLILNGDFAKALKGLRKGAFVYFDPPYMPVSSSSSFTGYTENGFDKSQQIRLKDECDKLNSRGIKFLQSNSDCEFIRELYEGYSIKTISAKRSINSKGNKRGEINEVLIYNYDIDEK